MKRRTIIYPVLFMLFALASLAFTPAQAQSGKVIWTQVVQLDAQLAGSTSEAKGLAIFRLTNNRELTYKIIVHKLEEDDALFAGHIHYVSGGAIAINLTPGVQDLGHFQTIQLTPLQYNAILNQDVYVNLHSAKFPGGVLRGDIE